MQLDPIDKLLILTLCLHTILSLTLAIWILLIWPSLTNQKTLGSRLRLFLLSSLLYLPGLILSLIVGYFLGFA